MKKTLGVLKSFQFCSTVYADLEKTLPKILLLSKGEIQDTGYHYAFQNYL